MQTFGKKVLCENAGKKVAGQQWLDSGFESESRKIKRILCV